MQFLVKYLKAKLLFNIRVGKQRKTAFGVGSHITSVGSYVSEVTLYVWKVLTFDGFSGFSFNRFRAYNTLFRYSHEEFIRSSKIQLKGTIKLI